MHQWLRERGSRCAVCSMLFIAGVGAVTGCGGQSKVEGPAGQPANAPKQPPVSVSQLEQGKINIQNDPKMTPEQKARALAMANAMIQQQKAGSGPPTRP